MKHTFTLALALILSQTAFAKNTDTALKLVPNGKVVAETLDEVRVQTAGGTVVEIEFDKNGKFEEASGDALATDVLIPGEGLLSLADVVAGLKKEGKSPVGDWSLEKSFIRGWHYDFEALENGQKMEYVVDAKTGKILESKLDD